MTYQKTKKLLKKILKEDPVKIGVFISLLSYELIQMTGDSNTKFLGRLGNSLKILKQNEKNK